MKTHHHNRRRAARGLSLIEVLVVIVLFSFGLIGMVAMQAKAVQNSVSAEDSTRAALLANDLVSQMWANGNINLPSSVVTDWSNGVADATARGLPNGTGTVSITAGIATVTVTWRAPHEPVGTVHTYTTQVRMP